MITRSRYTDAIRTALERSRIVVLLGPRQSGKTTLARTFVDPDSPNYFDLEDPTHLAHLAEPMTALRSLTGIVVIDEVQRRPDLFPVLRVLADRTPLPSRFLILGSASPHLLRQSSESLAGRMEIIQIDGFGLDEIGAASLDKHWLRGGFPLSYLSATEKDSSVWRSNFIGTIIDRDLPQLGVTAPAVALHRFWGMLAHYHGQIWNAVEPAQSIGTSQPTVRRYLDILTGMFMIRQLQPLHVNIGKRQVKSPKIYFRDSGILHSMLNISTQTDLLYHPKCGASWEGYIIEEVLKTTAPNASYFWATQNGAEIDLVIESGNRRWGIECKRADAPKFTPSMRIALEDLGIEQIAVIYPGTRRFVINEQVVAVPVESIASGMSGIFGK